MLWCGVILCCVALSVVVLCIVVGVGPYAPPYLSTVELRRLSAGFSVDRLAGHSTYRQTSYLFFH